MFVYALVWARDDSTDAYINLDCDTIAVRHLRTLLSLILTNSEVRKLLQDFSTIGRDLLAKTAAKAAETIAPSNEALENVDQSAPNDQFVTEKGRNVGPGETPVLEARVPGTGHTIVQHPKEDEAIVRTEEGRERPIGEVKAEGIDRYQQYRAQGVTAGNQVLGESQSHARDLQNAESSEEVEAKKQGMMDRVRQMRVSCFDIILTAYTHLVLAYYLGQCPGMFSFLVISSITVILTEPLGRII